MDFIADVHLTDGPVLWAAWAAGAAGFGWLLWARGRRWALSAGAALLLSAAVVAAVHWLLIYAFSSLPEVLPREVLAWFVAAVFALFLWALRLWRLRPASAAKSAESPQNPLRSGAGAGGGGPP